VPLGCLPCSARLLIVSFTAPVTAGASLGVWSWVQLIAYGREFTRPRPYRLEDLARAAGMSVSGVRTAYDEDEVAEVARLTGTSRRRATGVEP
jgi:hypothetical protein